MQGEIPADMPHQMLLERWYAKNYGFTPTEVGELSLEQLTWFPLIEEAINRATEKLQKLEQQRQSTQARGGSFRTF
jgi:hypothetical protein